MQGNRFGIRHILVATAVIAFLSAIGKFASLNIATSILLAMVWLVNIGLAIAKPNLRWQITTIGICQIGPLLWTFRGQGVPIFNWRILGIATSLPSFLPTLLISSAFRQHFETYQWLATLFTTAELGIGVWLSDRAPKLAIVVMLLVLTQSLFGSFILNALIRM